MNALEAKKLARVNQLTLDVSKYMAATYKAIEAAAKKGLSRVEWDLGRTLVKPEELAAMKKQLAANGYSVYTDRNGKRTIKW